MDRCYLRFLGLCRLLLAVAVAAAMVAMVAATVEVANAWNMQDEDLGEWVGEAADEYIRPGGDSSWSSGSGRSNCSFEEICSLCGPLLHTSCNTM